tara:strand:- start:2583 stop:4478 length:1896 start_codon:yes stop_codon:yes gene_type:complete
MQSNENTRTDSSGGLLGFLDDAERPAVDDQQSRQVEHALVAFRDLEKLMKNISLYGRDHQSSDRFIEKAFSSVKETIDVSGSLELVVRPYEISLHGHAVLENPSPERNFIYTLYLDGVRRLSLLPEITQDELVRFVDILGTDWDEPRLFEDDMVTLLWSSHFGGIKYSVLDNFAEDTSEDDRNVYTVAGVVNRVRQKGDYSADGPQNTSFDRASRRLKRVNLSGMELTDRDLDSFNEVIFEMDEREFDQLRTTVHTTAREKLEKFIEILFKVHLIQEVSEEARRGRITALFDRIADLLLESGSIGELERLLRTIRRLNGPEDRVIRENVLAIEHIVEHWSAQPFIDRVTLGLRQPNFPYRPSVLAICELLSRRAAKHIARVAGRIHDQETRALLWELVESKLSGQEQTVAELLADADRQHAHEILRLLKRVVDPEDLKHAIETALNNLDPKVRLEALTSLPVKAVDRYQSSLLRIVHDPAKSVRSRVLHLLARLRSTAVFERLASAIESKEFAEYELDEKRRFYAAAALAGGGADRWIQQFKANALLSTKGQDATRHCAAIALGILLHRDSLKMLEKEAKRRLKYPLAAEAAVWAMQHMACTREERTRQLYDLFYHGKLTGDPAENAGTHD